MKKFLVGQYKCGCTYGPTARSERLRYCSTHGEDIQVEYEVPNEIKSTIFGKTRCPNCDEIEMVYDAGRGLWQCLSCGHREDLG